MDTRTKGLLFTGALILLAWALSYFADAPAAVPETLETSGEEQSIVFTAAVSSVVDGDTIRVQTDDGLQAVRLIGVDTPEMAGSPTGAQCYGAEATSYVREWLEGESVQLETDPTQARYDTYDRLLAYVTIDNVDVGEKLIAEGYAKEYSFRGKTYAKQSLYRSTEDAAMSEGRGLWSVCQ